jgi:hypothetical protein
MRFSFPFFGVGERNPDVTPTVPAPIASCRPDYTSQMELHASSPSTIRVVLFDIGGVLVEPSGVATMLAWMRNSVSPEQLWRMWLTSSCVRAFETGRLSPEAFADQVIAEFGLPVSRQGYL